VKRATASSGPYTNVAMNLTGLDYTDTGLTLGTTYYYVITATNSFGESADSVAVNAQPVVTTPPQLLLVAGGGQVQMSWPADHLGWQLEVQTNSSNAGLGTNWVTVPNSAATNQIFVPVNAANGSVFFRLAYP